MNTRSIAAVTLAPGFPPPARQGVGALIVTFGPDPGIAARLHRIASEVAAVVIVDNTGPGAERDMLGRLAEETGWTLLANQSNEGIAAALNRGVRHLAARGFGWVLIFDQDSEPEAGMTHAMARSWLAHPHRERIAIMGPRFWDPLTGAGHRVLRAHPGCRWWFQKVAVDDADLPEVTMVISSGSLLRVDAFVECGGFDEGFFIDYVDTDFCLKCLRRDWLVAVSAAAGMKHTLGQRQVKKCLGISLSPTNHKPFRHFYIARNRVIMWKRHARAHPHWAFFDLAVLALWVARVGLAERDRGAKFKAMITGTWAGLRNRRGKMDVGRP